MSRIHVHGLGAVSPAGWGVPLLSAALKQGEPLPSQPLPRPECPHCHKPMAQVERLPRAPPPE